jgi:hypothetical protein
MKIKELIIVSLGVLIFLTFMSLMFKNYIRNQELQIIKKRTYYDSLLLNEQIKMKKKDSIILHQQKLLKDMLNGHANQIHTINKKVKNLEENGENKQQNKN